MLTVGYLIIIKNCDENLSVMLFSTAYENNSLDEGNPKCFHKKIILIEIC